jgi:hypothetical protein
MLQLLEVNSVPVGLHVYKMYNPLGVKPPTSPTEGYAWRERLRQDIMKGTKCFKKVKGDGAHPIGYVIQADVTLENGTALQILAISVKSARDTWNSKTGLRLAYEELVEQLQTTAKLSPSKADRTALAAMCGLSL